MKPITIEKILKEIKNHLFLSPVYLQVSADPKVGIIEVPQTCKIVVRSSEVLGVPQDFDLPDLTPFSGKYWSDVITPFIKGYKKSESEFDDVVCLNSITASLVHNNYLKWSEIHDYKLTDFRVSLNILKFMNSLISKTSQFKVGYQDWDGENYQYLSWGDPSLEITVYFHTFFKCFDSKTFNTLFFDFQKRENKAMEVTTFQLNQEYWDKHKLTLTNVLKEFRTQLKGFKKTSNGQFLNFYQDDEGYTVSCGDYLIYKNLKLFRGTTPFFCVAIDYLETLLTYKTWFYYAYKHGDGLYAHFRSEGILLMGVLSHLKPVWDDNLNDLIIKLRTRYKFD